MKKICMFVLMFSLCIILVGCSNAQNAVGKKLNNELNGLEKTLASIKTIDNSEIDIAQTYNLNKTKEKTIISNTLDTNNQVNACKTQLTELVDMLKVVSSKIKSGDVLLTDNQIKGINQLLSNLSTNCNHISMTKNEINSNVGKIKTLTNKTEDIDSINARFVKLNNNLNSRLTYYKNCINVLNQIRVVLSEHGLSISKGDACNNGDCIEDNNVLNYADSCPNCGEKKTDENQTNTFLKNPVVKNKNEQSDDNQENKKIVETKKQPNTHFEREPIEPIGNNEYRHITGDKIRNIDTYKNPTVRRNIDTFRRVNNHVVSPHQLWIEWANRNLNPFEKTITETNIVIQKNDNDKQFVEQTKVITEEKAETQNEEVSA